ncbi:hypothetical protein HK414_22115 [Ramlibacter terrae]|uniref:Tripartite tricarboxylate transporter substrate binding protein n=1 Tax=Ramlibacter terrae TaxID=2732511 RepID=A0ABX6P6R6_9BURK|nr:hypothetical protein HK414_22115 [Ramlibacter terrae]
MSAPAGPPLPQPSLHVHAPQAPVLPRRRPVRSLGGPARLRRCPRRRLPRAPGDPDRAVPGRRHRRHRVPRAGQVDRAAPGATHRDREPAGRERYPWRRRRCPGQAGRLPDRRHAFRRAAAAADAKDHVQRPGRPHADPAGERARRRHHRSRRFAVQVVQGLHRGRAQAPRIVTYGTNGTATSQNLALVTLAAQENVKLNHIPYKGDAEATVALLGGHIDAQAGGTILGNMVDGGKARWLAVFSDRRLKKWPDAPTLFDLGYKIPASSPTGLVGPANMPPAVVKKLHDAFRAGLNDQGTVSALERNAMDVYYRDGTAYGALIRESYEIEKERVRRAGLLMGS